jgi:P-type conjugative transfer protein TrbJ
MKRLLLRIGIVMAGFIFTMSLNVDEAHAGVVAGLATEWTQIMNNVQLVLQYEQQIQQYATQLQQAQTQIEHLEEAYKQTGAMVQGIGNGNFNFSAIANDLSALNGVVQYGNGLAYSMANLDDEFNARFPGYGNANPTNYAGMYRNWYNTNLDTAHSALKVAGLQYSQLNNDAALVRTLQQQSQNSTTLLQTLQVGNSLAAQELAELEKLRQLMLTDITSKATYQAQQAASAQADGDMNDTFFTVPTGSNTDTRTYAPVPQQ